MLFSLFVSAQQFEESKLRVGDFKGKKIELGADIALQYQILDHSYNTIEANDKLIPIGDGFNLPTANFTISGYILEGVKVNLTTYLSSRHHQEAWVKDGYILMDAMTFLKTPTIDSLMKSFRLKFGMMEMNYGDSHFRRSDNGNAMNNLFVGNYILDAFTTSVGLEIYYQKNGILAMVGVSNGALKPELAGSYKDENGDSQFVEYNTIDELAYLFKLGYDKQFNNDLRLRATASLYISPDHHKGSLYNSERAGSRYYLVLNTKDDGVNPTSPANTGRYNLGATMKNNAYMFNVFGKYKFVELFFTHEITSGKTIKDTDFDLSQFAIEGIWRLGKNEQFHVGVRYNSLINNAKGSKDLYNRIQIGAGWNLSHVLFLKAEYVKQNNKNTILGDGEFNGMMFEFAVRL